MYTCTAHPRPWTPKFPPLAPGGTSRPATYSQNSMTGMTFGRACAGCRVVQKSMQCLCGGLQGPQWAKRAEMPHILSPHPLACLPHHSQLLGSPRFQRSEFPSGSPGNQPSPNPATCAGPAESDCSSGPPGPPLPPLGLRGLAHGSPCKHWLNGWTVGAVRALQPVITHCQGSWLSDPQGAGPQSGPSNPTARLGVGLAGRLVTVGPSPNLDRYLCSRRAQRSRAAQR